MSFKSIVDNRVSVAMIVLVGNSSSLINVMFSVIRNVSSSISLSESFVIFFSLLR